MAIYNQLKKSAEIKLKLEYIFGSRMGKVFVKGDKLIQTTVDFTKTTIHYIL